MKRLSVVVLAFSLIAASCVVALPFGGISGNGKVISSPLSLSSFDSIKNMSSAKVRVTRGAFSRATVSIDENLLDSLDIRVENGVLIISVQPGRSIFNYREFTVDAVLPSLSSAGVYGSGDIEISGKMGGRSVSLTIAGSGDISGEFDADTLNAIIQGSGSIDLAGTARSFTGTIQGSGSVRANRFTATDAKAGIYGSGSCTLRVERNLDAAIFGSGSIYYYGSPVIVSQVDKGSGKLRQLYF